MYLQYMLQARSDDLTMTKLATLGRVLLSNLSSTQVVAMNFPDHGLHRSTVGTLDDLRSWIEMNKATLSAATITILPISTDISILNDFFIAIDELAWLTCRLRCWQRRKRCRWLNDRLIRMVIGNSLRSRQLLTLRTSKPGHILSSKGTHSRWEGIDHRIIVEIILEVKINIVIIRRTRRTCRA